MWMYCNVLHQPNNVHCRPSIAISSIVVSISRWHVYLHWIQEMWFHFTSKVGTELPPCTWQCVEITGRKRPTRSNVLDLVVLIIYTSIPFTKGIGDSTQLRDLTCCMPSWFKNCLLFNLAVDSSKITLSICTSLEDKQSLNPFITINAFALNLFFQD